MLFVLIFALLWLPITLLIPTKVINKKNLPKRKDGAYILVSNHYSNFDVILFDIKLGRKYYYLAKKELFKNKFVAWFLRKLGGIKIDRQSNDITAFKNAMQTLKQNKPLGIFPEGTRNKGEDTAQMQEAKSGAIVFASKAGVPIIPMAIYRRPKLFRSNKILIGEPFLVEGENPKKLTKEEIEINTKKLEEIMKNLHSQLVDKYSKKRKNANKKCKNIVKMLKIVKIIAI